MAHGPSMALAVGAIDPCVQNLDSTNHVVFEGKGVMAVYQFSALSDGQAISFNPDVDRLNFDQAAIAAADIRTSIEGSNLRISVVSGSNSGKDVLLLDVKP